MSQGQRSHGSRSKVTWVQISRWAHVNIKLHFLKLAIATHNVLEKSFPTRTQMMYARLYANEEGFMHAYFPFFIYFHEKYFITEIYFSL